MIDPDNPPSRQAAERFEVAADGGARQPAANTFAQFVGFLEDGDFDREMSGVLKDIASEMANAAINAGGKSKGKLTVSFEFALDGRVTSITPKYKVDLPQEKRTKSVMWMTEDGRFTPSNPRQGEMFGVREVHGSSGIRDA